MAPLLTVTFSPCIDKSTTVPKLIPEKKLTCSQPVYEPGGGGINVARVLGRLGLPATAFFPAGGRNGEFLRELAAAENVLVENTFVQAETRENLHVTDLATNQQYRFGMPAVSLSKEEWNTLLNTLATLTFEGFLVVSGSLPHDAPEDIFSRIAEIAQGKKVKLIIDSSGPALQKAVSAGVYLIKPNIGELAALAGKEELQMEQVEEVAKALIQHRHCEIIVVSLGQSGALLVTSDKLYRAIPPAVVRVSTVGAGDSMLAGIIYGLSRGWDFDAIIRYGVACGTAACMNPGTALCNLDDIDRIFALTKGFNS